MPREYKRTLSAGEFSKTYSPPLHTHIHTEKNVYIRSDVPRGRSLESNGDSNEGNGKSTIMSATAATLHPPLYVIVLHLFIGTCDIWEERRPGKTEPCYGNRVLFFHIVKRFVVYELTEIDKKWLENVRKIVLQMGEKWTISSRRREMRIYLLG